MKTIQKTKELAKKYYENAKAPTPRWAKMLRNIGIVLTAIGTGIATAPAIFPTALVAASGYMIAGGGIATGIFQGFKKS